MTQKQFIEMIKQMDISEKNIAIIEMLSNKLINHAYNDGWTDAMRKKLKGE